MRLSHSVVCIVLGSWLVQPGWATLLVTSHTNVVKASNAFAIDLYAEISRETGNLVASPYSISTALALVHAGAQGETAEDIAKVLRFPENTHSAHTYHGTLLKELKERNTSGSEIILANALFAQSGYPYLKPFQELLRETYDTELNEIDLTGWPNTFDPTKAAAARKQINNWVAHRTQRRIIESVPPTLPKPDTRLILINAVWFKGRWAVPFSSSQTTNAPFYLNPHKPVSVPTMRLTFVFRYSENEMLQILELPYFSERFSMVILLPKVGNEVADLEKTLSSSQLEDWHRTCVAREVEIALPRFRLQSGFDLKSPLQRMGLKTAFDPTADFGGITPLKPFFVGTFVHESNIEVDEEGTTAAATTHIYMVTGNTPTRPVFNANRPFLFLIRDNQTGLVLFIGRVADPSRS